MTIIGYLLSTYSVYFMFVIVISILGNFILFTYQIALKKRLMMKPAERFFLSHIIGIFLFLIESYILSFFQIFNFFTAYLPLCVLIIVYLGFLAKNGKLRELKTKFQDFMKSNKTDIRNTIIIIFLVFTLEFILFYPIFEESIALVGKDAYFWTKQVVFLLENGTIHYSDISLIYPPGFIFFCAGNVLISPDFISVYYFMKVGCLPFLNLYSLAFLVILKRIFKKKWIILTLFVITISNLYFQYRIVQFLSSSLSIYFILIGIMILSTKVPKYFLGIILAGSFMVNPIYSFYFSIVVFTYYIIRVIQNRGIASNKGIVKELYLLVIVAVVSTVPYILSVYLIYSGDVVVLINTFVNFFRVSGEEPFLHPIDLSPISQIFTLGFIEVFQEWLYYGFFLFLPIMGIMLIVRRRNERHNDFNIFLIVAAVFTLFMLFISPLFTLGWFFDMFYIRTLEVFLPLLIILAGYSLKALINFSKSLWRKVMASRIILRKFFDKHPAFNQTFNLSNIIIILVLSSSLFVYIHSRDNMNYPYRYDDSIIDCVFYVRENITPSSAIGVNFINHTHTVYHLLDGYDLYNYNEADNWTFGSFSNFITLYSLEFFIINLSAFNAQFINDFTVNATYVKLLGGSELISYSLYSVF